MTQPVAAARDTVQAAFYSAREAAAADGRSDADARLIKMADGTRIVFGRVADRLEYRAKESSAPVHAVRRPRGRFTFTLSLSPLTLVTHPVDHLRYHCRASMSWHASTPTTRLRVLLCVAPFFVCCVWCVFTFSRWQTCVLTRIIGEDFRLEDD